MPLCCTTGCNTQAITAYSVVQYSVSGFLLSTLWCLTEQEEVIERRKDAM